MKRRLAIFWSILAVLVLAVGGFFALGQKQSSTSSVSSKSAIKRSQIKKSTTAAKKGKNGKVLVVYFSRTEGVYGGKLKVGNTARVAQFIQAETKGDMYEIVPKKSYPTSYDETTKVAQQEQDENARPAIKNALPDVKKYQTVFIGAPIWWGEYPMVVRTFLDNENLNSKDKTVIPFTTSGGSGLGNTAEVLEKTYPKATIAEGFTVEGNTVRDNPSAVQSRVNKWLKKLGY